jgi:hypothetical protein
MNENNWRMVNAFERGIDDGFFQGTQNPPLGRSDDERLAYKRGYDHGLWLYCETLENGVRGLALLNEGIK